MIQEDYVSLETAKLLKEKGFDEPCQLYFDKYHGVVPLYVWEGELKKYFYYQVRNSNICIRIDFVCTCPTIQRAMKWLREVHNLCIEPYRTACGYLSTISKIPTGSTLYYQEYEGDDEDSGQFISYEKSCEAAIKYCLRNLI